MNTTGKVIVGAIVVLVIAGGLYYWYSTMHESGSMNASSTAMMEGSTTSAMAGATSGVATGAAAAANNPLPSGSNTSDAALQQDTASIDAQMTGLNSDNAAVTASENDQPISQQ